MARMLDGMQRLLRGEVPPPPAATRIGMRLASFEDGAAVVELEADASHANPMGTVQGGILAALADAAMGWAYMTTLGEGESYATLEIKMNYLRPVRQGHLEARARLRHAGRTVGLLECDVVGEGGKAVAYAVSTCMTLRGGAAEGR
jgi:uncharacterized protein (TIGR00369 family)